MSDNLDFKPFADHCPAMWRGMRQRGWTTVEALANPVITYSWRDDLAGWEAMLMLPSTGPRKLLRLVNFLRDNGVELPWFADWDKSSADWASLKGCLRAEPCRGN
jgi:hypothetical protein